MQESIIPTLNIVGLTLAYLVVAALLLSLNLYSSWNWLVKTAMNFSVALLFLVTYHSWPGILGWPTERDLPEQFYLHAIVVDEPNRIYLWGADLDHGLGRTVPRAFGLPYSTKLHDRVDKANRKLRKGLPVIGQVKTGGVADSNLTSLEQIQAADSDIVFIDAPQGLIPDKN